MKFMHMIITFCLFQTISSLPWLVSGLSYSTSTIFSCISISLSLSSNLILSIYKFLSVSPNGFSPSSLIVCALFLPLNGTDDLSYPGSLRSLSTSTMLWFSLASSYCSSSYSTSPSTSSSLSFTATGAIRLSFAYSGPLSSSGG